MKKCFAIMPLVVSFLSLPLFASDSAEYEVRYDFVDAVVVRRMIVGLPQFDRTEILGTAELFKNGVSSALLGQYDVSADIENPDVKIAFSSCVSKAMDAIKDAKGFIVKGTSSLPLSGGYKNLIFLETISSCEIK